MKTGITVELPADYRKYRLTEHYITVRDCAAFA